MTGRHKFFVAMILAAMGGGTAALASPAPSPSPNAESNTVLPPPAFAPHVRKLHAVDADNHNILINRPGQITVVVGTNEDTQDAARDAGRALYPFRGRPDFGLVVVVDLRHSIASWVPSIVITRMRVSLDHEAEELKPYFLKNGNKSNPRADTHVIPDFTGTVCPQLNWPEGADSLRVILYGVDGRELERLDKVDNMSVLQEEVRKALQAQVDLEQAKLAAAAKTPGSKLLHPVFQHPPLVPYTPLPPKKDDN